MVAMTAKYKGGLACVVQHGPSSTMLETDAPVDIGGSGRSFSPTDLVGTALLTCILTTVASVADKYQIDVTGMEGSVEKIMTESVPRRIAKFIVHLDIPVAENHPMRDKLDRAVHYCPVSHALSPDIVKDVHIKWA